MVAHGHVVAVLVEEAQTSTADENGEKKLSTG